MRTVKFITPGGWPLELDDLGQIQIGWQDNSTGLGRALSTTDEIIQLEGAVVNTTTNTVTEGWVSFKGLAYYVPAQTFSAPASGHVLYWQIVETSEGGPGDKVFQDSTSHSTYFTHTFQIASGATVPSGAVNIANTVTFANRMREVLNNQSWIFFPAPYHNDAFYGPGNTPDSSNRRYFKTLDGMVHMKGEFYFDTSTPTNLLIGTLPVGYRPPHNLDFDVLSGLASPLTYNVRITSGGEVRILNAEGYNIFHMMNIPAFSTKS